MSNNNNNSVLYFLLFIIGFGIIGWVYIETDKVEGVAGNLMKVIILIALVAVYILWKKK
jgi:hypothetical protein